MAGNAHPRVNEGEFRCIGIRRVHLEIMLQLLTSLLGIPQGETTKSFGCDCHWDIRYIGRLCERVDPFFRCANKIRESLLSSCSRTLKQSLGNKARISRIHRSVQSRLCDFAVPLTRLPVYLEFGRCPKHGNLSTLTYVQILLRGKLLDDRNSSSAFRLIKESLCQEKTELPGSRRMPI